MRKFLLAGASTLALSAAAHAQGIPVTVQDANGNAVCNPAAAFSAIPGAPGTFLGRVVAVGSTAYCAAGQFGATEPHLGVFALTWPNGTPTLTLGASMFTGLPKTVNGIYIRTIYDPIVVSFNGALWAAAECTPHFNGVEYVSICMFPLIFNTSNGQWAVDATRFNVPVVGVNSGGVQISASVPVLASFNGALYLYFTNDGNQDQTTAFNMVTRGVQITFDSAGLPWAVGSVGAPVSAVAPTIVEDVNPGDPTANHQAALRSVWSDPSGTGLYAMSTIGGGLCAFPNSSGTGCFRTKVTYTQNPLAYNTFASNPQPTDQIPGQPVDYPHTLTAPNGVTYMWGEFFKPGANTYPGYAPAIAACAGILTNTSCLLPMPGDVQ